MPRVAGIKMKNLEFFLPLLILGYLLAASAQDTQKQPKLEHFDPNQADRSLDPCQDFYKFACNKWFAANPIPADEMYWNTGSTLGLWNESVLRETMEKASVDSPDRTPVYQKVGDFWAACMDERRVDEAGTRVECTPKMRQEIKGPITLNGGEQCLCPDKSIPAN